MEYFDQERGEKYVPHIMETSAGLTRIFMMLLDSAWTEEEIENAEGKKDTRVVLRIKRSMAPVKAAVLPLFRKDHFKNKAKEIKCALQGSLMVEYDETGSIGKRYRRQDEIGTPFCVTVDHQTLEDDTVTVRDRDSMEQIRLSIDELESYLVNEIEG
jgi:glycyl-tRNA synthetase